MKIKTDELTGAALDWAVAKSEFDELAALNIQYPQHAMFYPKVSPSTDWALGGPIIEREEIFLAKSILGGWTASIYVKDERVRCTLHEGPTPLIAAMRCYVTSKLGDEVEIPEELR